MRALTALLFLALAAYADIFNQKTILVGDKGAALGGAYAGVADDATATYYNPAGLMQIQNIKLNVSAQIVQYQQQEIQIAPGALIPYNSFNFTPSITAFSQRMGNWAYGFSIVTPVNDLFRGEQQIEAAYRDTAYDDGPCVAAPGDTPCYTRLNLSYYDVSKINYIGPSVAFKFSETISLGATVYGIYYTQLEKTAFGGWDANYVGGDPNDLSRWHESLVTRSVNQTGLGLTGNFGILVKMSPELSLGVSASPGSMVFIDRREEQRSEDFFNDSLRLVEPGQTDTIKTQAIIYNLDRQVKHTEISAPRLSVGVSWKPWSRLMLTGQTDYVLGSLYSYTGFSPVTSRKIRSGFEYNAPEEKHYTVEKQSVLNFAGGMDLRLTKVYSVAAGGFTDFSQGPYEDRPSSWNRRIDYYGFTFSVGMDKEFTQSRFGCTASWGDAAISHFQWTKDSGGQPVLATDVNGRILRVRRNFDAFNFGILLSSNLKI